MMFLMLGLLVFGLMFPFAHFALGIFAGHRSNSLGCKIDI